jgi:hypothetical protein
MNELIRMLCDGYPIPPCPDCPPLSPFESFLGLWLVFWMMFFLVVYVLPKKCGDAIWRIAFPFAPRVDAEAEQPKDPESLRV